MQTVYYGKVGTQEVIAGSPFTKDTLSKDYVVLKTPNPPTEGDYSFYVVDVHGEWSYPQDDNVIKQERQRRILKSWPVEKQLEAQSDASQGDYTKLNELAAFLKRIKEQLPYNDRPLKYE